MDSQAEPEEFNAVDYVPLWAASLGVMSAVFTAIWVFGRDTIPGSGALLVIFLVIASLGATLGLCGVLLALRDRRHLGLALGGLAGNLLLPMLLLFAGAP